MNTTTGGSNAHSGSPSGIYDGGEEMNRCKRCELTYLPSKSSSALRLTYCSFFCELGDLGFSMDSLERMEQAEHDEEAAEPTSGDGDTSEIPEEQPNESGAR